MRETQPYYIKDVKVTDVPGDTENDPRRYEGRVFIEDPEQTVDSYGTLKQVYKETIADDPYQAVHGALQEAALVVDPATPQAQLLFTTSVQILPAGGYRGEARFKVGNREVPSMGYHPYDKEAAKLNAVVRGNQRLHLYKK